MGYGCRRVKDSKNERAIESGNQGSAEASKHLRAEEQKRSLNADVLESTGGWLSCDCLVIPIDNLSLLKQ